MGISNISTEALRHELRLRQARVSAPSTRRRTECLPVFEIQDLSDDDSLFIPERRMNLANENAIQSTATSTECESRLLQTEDSRKRRRDRSLEDNVNTSRISRSDHFSATEQQRRTIVLADNRDIGGKAGIPQGLAQQEEEDRQIAERLQDEEYLGIAETLSLSRLSGSRKRAATGSKSDPIDLDCITSFPSSPRTVRNTVDRIRAGKRTFQSQPFRRRIHDADVARQLQEEERQAQDERTRQAALRTHDCAVCGDNTLFIELPSLLSCSHQPEVCGGCYASWVASQLEANGWQEVKCPGTSCKVNLAYEEIKAYASKDIFERYDAFKARSALASDPNFRWCRAEGCLSGQIHDPEEVGHDFVCVECHTRFCTVHEGPYHDNETCDEYEYRTSGQKERDERKKEEEASEEAIGKLTKPCPGQNCGWPIEKNGGCAHMSCLKCKHQFCWQCLKVWRTCKHG